MKKFCHLSRAAGSRPNNAVKEITKKIRYSINKLRKQALVISATSVFQNSSITRAYILNSLIIFF